MKPHNKLALQEMKTLFVVVGKRPGVLPVQFFYFISILLSATLFPGPAVAKTDSKSPELVVHLLDYIAKDYGGAIREGKVTSSTEYREQLEFAGIVEKTAREVPVLSADAAYFGRLEGLVRALYRKEDSEAVAKLARRLQQDTIQLAKIDVTPSHLPSLAEGRRLYEANCVACHGPSGRGDGIAGAHLEPRPANFVDPDLAWNTAAYNYFNTIRLGVPGTGMAAFASLSDREVWALAFYLKALPYFATGSQKKQLPTFPLRDLATLTDSELAGALHLPRDEAAQTLGALRAYPEPEAAEDPLDKAIQLVEDSFSSARTGNLSQAQSQALAAYLDGVEPLEPKIRANLPGAVEELETLMNSYRSELKAGVSGSLSTLHAQILKSLREIKARLSSEKMSAKVAFFAAFSIFLREGFEAVLIVIVLISILKAMNQRRAIIWVHVGWVSAVSLGIAGWFASGFLLSISGMKRELMEGSISVLAVLVLLYVGFWLHRHAETKKWHAFLKEKLRRGVGSRSYLGLALVSFLAVFREAIEVVLFLRAIWIDLDSSGQSVASLGIVTSIGVLAALSVVAIRQSEILPLGLLFRLCSWTMIFLALILAGKGIHSLQEAGLLSVSPFGIAWRADLIGVYPTLQTFGAQAFVLTLIVGVAIMERRRLPAKVRG